MPRNGASAKWNCSRTHASINIRPAQKTLTAPAGGPAPRWCKCALMSTCTLAARKNPWTTLNHKTYSTFKRFSHNIYNRWCKISFFYSSICYSAITHVNFFSNIGQIVVFFVNGGLKVRLSHSNNIRCALIIGTCTWLYVTSHDRSIPVLLVMKSWHVNHFHITGPLWGESTSHWWFPLQRASNAEFVVSFDVNLNKLLKKQFPVFRDPMMLLWHHCNAGRTHSSEHRSAYVIMIESLQQFHYTIQVISITLVSVLFNLCIGCSVDCSASPSFSRCSRARWDARAFLCDRPLRCASQSLAVTNTRPLQTSHTL